MFSRKKVFIIHGHDEQNVDRLVNILESWGLIPIVLLRQPSGGRTVIEKFEHYASHCDIAIALMTPDDKMAQDLSGAEVFQARQNLYIEMGWFMAFRKREKVLLLHNAEVEIPSELLGLIYIQFTNSVHEISEKLERELRNAGAPMNT